ncbi:hypothetical protein M3Y99_00775100 [Aphelenchoides fujianensis]|nr:hypothetical protein M3Y99_00775100 [Aphelenchoides fujianensis]
MNRSATGIVLLLAVGFSMAAIHRTSYYSSDRKLVCINHGVNITRCALHEEGKYAEQNPGCFDELDEKNQTRVYCRLNCEESDEASVLAKHPNNNHECNNDPRLFYEQNRNLFEYEDAPNGKVELDEDVERLLRSRPRSSA